jgi:hypothetical protein
LHSLSSCLPGSTAGLQAFTQPTLDGMHFSRAYVGASSPLLVFDDKVNNLT